MNELLCHLTGDYPLQSSWMALNKHHPGLEGAYSCVAHSIIYTIPFLFLTQDLWRLVLIAGSHFVIDRYRLASECLRVRNGVSSQEWPNIPLWCITVCDQWMHLLINHWVLMP